MADKQNLIRPLEGYRALAILAVLLFHLDFSFAKGGFLGVDIFFVISGFIITKIIFSQMEKGEFSLSHFYYKRYRRLFPALILTVFVTLVFAFFIISPEDFAQLGKSALYSLFSLANINFWMEAGYFDAAAHTKPLLHMWSLSVEEQFYLFWPLTLLLFAKIKNKTTLVFFVLALAIASFIATWVYSTKSPSTAFFWFPFRIFQFMSGAVFALMIVNISNKVVLNLVNLVFAALFLLGCYFATGTTPIWLSGGIAAVAGAGLIISMKSRLAELAFGNRLMVFFGQHSYSIYLVHWPLIVLYKYEFGAELSTIEKIALALISIGLGVLLRRLIEQPFRIKKSQDSFGKYATTITTIVLGLSIFASSSIWGHRGVPGRINADISDLTKKDQTYQTYMRMGDCFLSTLRHSITDLKDYCYKSEKGKKNFLLIGSSLAADLYHGLDQNMEGWNGYQLTSAKCSPVIYKPTKDLCDDMRKVIFEDAIKNYDFDLVILGGIQPRGRAVQQTIEFLEEQGKDYVFIGNRIVFSKPPQTLVSQYGKIDGLDEFMQRNIERSSDSNTLDKKNFFSIDEALCSDVCQWQNKGTLIYRDKIHFSTEGSMVFGSKFSQWLKERDK